MERLRDGGYQSACIGKTHFLPGRNPFIEAFDVVKEGASMIGQGNGAYDRFLRERRPDQLLYPLGLRQEFNMLAHRTKKGSAASWTILSSKAGIPKGRSFPPLLGIYRRLTCCAR